MTDAFEAQGDLVPAQSVSASAEFNAGVESPELEALDAAAAPQEPSGFARLGLSPQLLAAVEDLGFSQPTAVQDKAIPLAMGTDAKGFVDL
ncbi:MAG: DEAD/DEAH box helicase, partial [Proteobacteria bacterium]|nr:DEAD/DEAH box helicase [Pseudomonadota bacterium]